MHQTLNTYDHVLFQAAEKGQGPTPDRLASFSGNNLARVPGLTGIPGSSDRLQLVLRLRARHGDGLLVAGAGWPSRISVGRIPTKNRWQLSSGGA